MLLWPHDKAHRNSSLLVKTELVESELSLLPWWHLKWLGHQTLWVKTKWQLTKLMMWYYGMIWSRRRSKKMSFFFSLWVLRHQKRATLIRRPTVIGNRFHYVWRNIENCDKKRQIEGIRHNFKSYIQSHHSIARVDHLVPSLQFIIFEQVLQLLMSCGQ